MLLPPVCAIEPKYWASGIATVGGVRPHGRNRGNQRIELHTWKENVTEPGFYHKSEKTIVLAPNTCNYEENNGQYTCRLRDIKKQVSVEPGDILGIELPPRDDADFVLHSVSAPGMINYIFGGTDFPTTVHLCDRINEIEVQPLIMPLRIDMQVESGILAIHNILDNFPATVITINVVTGDSPGQSTNSYNNQSGSISCPTLMPTSMSCAPPGPGCFEGEPTMFKV